VDALAAFFAAVASGIAAIGAFTLGGLSIPPADATGRRPVRRAVVILWILAALAAAACVVFLYVALNHLAPGGGAED
jgi:hypothetical protein